MSYRLLPRNTAGPYRFTAAAIDALFVLPAATLVHPSAGAYGDRGNPVTPDGAAIPAVAPVLIRNLVL